MSTKRSTPRPGLPLEFANPTGPSVQLGPFSQLRFEGETLIAAPPDKEIAQHADHHWNLAQGGRFGRLDCNARVFIHFYSTKHLQSKKLGPYDSFSSIDGVAYADRKVMAFCDRQLQDWYSHELGSHWKVLVVEPA